jgi:hypothetical protein
VWQSRAAFEAWTQSEAFRAAHRDAGDHKPFYLGHPQFEGCGVRQTLGMGKAQPLAPLAGHAACHYFCYGMNLPAGE